MNTLFYTVLGYVWQYISNPKTMMALSFLVVIISIKNTVSDRISLDIADRLCRHINRLGDLYTYPVLSAY